jgi:Uma2 family endonuclease
VCGSNIWQVFCAVIWLTSVGNRSWGVVMDKLQEYFAAEVQQVWHFWPNVQMVYVYTSPTIVRIMTVDDELSAEPLIPGWRLPLANLFPPLEVPVPDAAP